MRARVTWYPVPGGRARSSVVEVTPDELATLRRALELPPESLANAIARIRTYNDHGSIVHMPFPLRMISRIRPFTPRPPRTAGAPIGEEEGKKE